MLETPEKLKARADRKSRKREEKMRQIADSALEALKELGYANTSLRDIAAKSDLSLGMLHYYFEDKTQLIIYCVRNYKSNFVKATRSALDGATGREAAIRDLSRALASTIVEEAAMHRLWYDIRNQALFDESFRPVVAEIEAMLIAVAKEAVSRVSEGKQQGTDLHYAILDGLFHHEMQAQVLGNERSVEDLAAKFAGILEAFA